MPSVYSIPGYVSLTLLSFWIPTLVSMLCVVVWRKIPAVRDTWVIKGYYGFIALTVFLQLCGWIVDAIWMHVLSHRLALAGSIICGIWAIALAFFGLGDREK